MDPRAKSSPPVGPLRVHTSSTSPHRRRLPSARAHVQHSHRRRRPSARAHVQHSHRRRLPPRRQRVFLHRLPPLPPRRQGPLPRAHTLRRAARTTRGDLRAAAQGRRRQGARLVLPRPLDPAVRRRRRRALEPTEFGKHISLPNVEYVKVKSVRLKATSAMPIDRRSAKNPVQ